MKEKILFIINPVSGNKSKEFIIELINRKFEKDAYTIKIAYTSFAGEASQMVKQYYHKGYTKVVAVGGDGTVNEVASALVDSGGILGIIPFGSGNGLARHLKIPLKASKALDLVRKGKQTKIDYGLINDRKFFCTTGVGFDAHIGHVFSKMKGRGFSNYVKATLSEYKKYKPKRYELTMNGTTIMRDAFLITFANASQYGNNAHIAPNADIRDGKLEIAVMRSFSILMAPIIGARLFLKNINKSNYLETYQCDKAILKRNNPGVIHYDGEPEEMGEIINIKVIHDGLSVMVN